MSRISVIVPVYKVEKYLDECVESLTAQTFRDIEIILVDDGSPDRCGEMCDAWAGRDGRIRVIHQKNGGLSAARNSGIRAASGELISLIDSDDRVEPGMLEAMARALEESGADAAVCGFAHEYEDGKTPREEVLPGEGVLTREEALAKTAEPGGVVFIVAWNRLCRRGIYDKVLFPEGKIHEDELTAHRILGETKKVVLVNRAFYRYRHREKSIMSSENREEDRVNNAGFLSERFDYFLEHGDGSLLQPCFETFLSAYTMAVRDMDPSNAALRERIAALSLKGRRMRKALKEMRLDARDELILRSPLMWRKLYALKGKLTGR